ncbi:amidohydrolase 2 [Thozetella sp. PMI_491]|nr:amidohydrolase 2 [Thozetella sp. PMI_491]
MADLVPSGAWDSHIHALDPDSFRYITPRYCTPPPAPIARYPASTTGCRNIVISHASMQGPSFAPILDILEQGPALGLTLRALVSIENPETVNDADLDALHAAGVRGSRLYMTLRTQKRLAARFARLGWVISIVCPLTVWAALDAVLRNLDRRVPVLADHFGCAFPGDERKEAFQTFLGLLRDRRVWVKLSAFDRLYEHTGSGMDSIEPLVKAFIETAPDQILYGTDWPHVGPGKPVVEEDHASGELEPFRVVSDEDHIRTLRKWITDDETWNKLFVGNPKKIFFGNAASW